MCLLGFLSVCLPVCLLRCLQDRITLVAAGWDFDEEIHAFHTHSRHVSVLCALRLRPCIAQSVLLIAHFLPWHTTKPTASPCLHGCCNIQASEHNVTHVSTAT
jgi:hypothetical protein